MTTRHDEAKKIVGLRDHAAQLRSKVGEDRDIFADIAERSIAPGSLVKLSETGRGTVRERFNEARAALQALEGALDRLLEELWS